MLLGTRRSELLSAKWSDIDLDQRTWRWPMTGGPLTLAATALGSGGDSPLLAKSREQQMGISRLWLDRPSGRPQESLAANPRESWRTRRPGPRFEPNPWLLGIRSGLYSPTHRKGPEPFEHLDNPGSRPLGLGPRQGTLGAKCPIDAPRRTRFRARYDRESVCAGARNRDAPIELVPSCGPLFVRGI